MMGLYIGRFQPFHNGHLELILHIMKTFTPSGLIVGIGSAQNSHTLKDPFTAGERFEMIDGTLRFEHVSRYHIVPVPDIDRHAVWVSHVASLVPAFEQVYSNDPLTRLLFSEAGYETPELPLFNRGIYEGREIRRRIVSGEPWEDLVPQTVKRLMDEIGGEKRIRMLSGSKEARRKGGGDDVEEDR